MISFMTVFHGFLCQASVSTSWPKLLSLIFSSICDPLSFLHISFDLCLSMYYQRRISDHLFSSAVYIKISFVCFFICYLCLCCHGNHRCQNMWNSTIAWLQKTPLRKNNCCCILCDVCTEIMVKAVK